MIFTEVEQQRFQAMTHDVCIIGSGPAGLTLAVSLVEKGVKVLLLEGGDFKDDSSINDIYEGQATPPHARTTEYRRQRFGGTSHLWGGRCVPLDDHDLQARGHVPESGWPLPVQELRAFETEAARHCDAGKAEFGMDALGGRAGSMFEGLQALAPDLVERVERYSLPTDFGAKYRQALTASPLATVVLRARVVSMHVAADGRSVDSLGVRLGRDRVAVSVPVRRVVISAGGIESARLMLVARQATPAWSAFDSTLGKYYACHYDSIFATVRFKGKRPCFLFERTVDGVYARRKLQFSASFQAKHALLNAAFRLHFPPYADPAHRSGVLSFIYLVKSILPTEHQAILNHGHSVDPIGAGRIKHVFNVLMDPISILSFGWDWVFKMKLAKRKLPYTLINKGDTYTIEFNSEQVQSAANRIELTNELDIDGMPRVHVTWQLTAQDVESGVRSFRLLRQKLATIEGVELLFDEGKLRASMEKALPVGGHHMGATRMGSSAKNSVVDTDLRVHGVSNLWICSASVFPTNGHANPTFTLVALAARLGRHLADRVQREA